MFMKNSIRPLLLGVNHTIAATALIYLIASGKFVFEERAIYAISAIFFWMGVQRLVKKLLPSE